MSSFSNKKPPVIEPAVIKDVFACGLDSVEVLGPNARFLHYVDRPPRHPGDGAERILIDQATVIPIEAVPEAIRITVFVLGRYWTKSTLHSLLIPG